MGIYYSAGYADVLEWDLIRELVPQEASEFRAVIDKHRGDEEADYLLAGLAQAIYYDDLSELSQRILGGDVAREAAAQIMRSYHKLGSAFAQATVVRGTDSRLELGIGYHNSAEAGCRGDELDGVYWCIADGAWILSPAGKKFNHKFKRKFFTSWG